MNGYGEFICKEGKKYYGFFKNDKKDGFGICYWPKDKFFIGFFKEGKQNGISKYINGINTKYRKWKNGKKENKNLNEEELFNNFNQFEKRFSKFFKWEIKKLKDYMEIE